MFEPKREEESPKDHYNNNNNKSPLDSANKKLLFISFIINSRVTIHLNSLAHYSI